MNRLCKSVTALILAALVLSGAAQVRAEEAASFAPSQVVTDGKGYWETPMDITDTQAVWEMLMSQITVVRGNQKSQVLLYSQPDIDSPPVGEITQDSQGLHVLETRADGFSLVECYSSSFAGGKTEAWNQLVQGYVKSTSLETKTPRDRYALLVDKLNQRLYIFENGEIYDTLVISTGLPNDRQPYNETRSGEFLIVSAVGGFRTDDLYCAMGLRFNAGDILHEVPHILRGDVKHYQKFEEELGQRASHGCIRVQRKRTPKGTNMTWIWNTLRRQMGTKLVIWEDLPGRQLPHEDPDMKLYYNTDGGQNYHSGETCYGVREKFLPMASFTYAQLDLEPYSRLTACPYCVPPRRVSEIDAINAAHSLP